MFLHNMLRDLVNSTLETTLNRRVTIVDERKLGIDVNEGRRRTESALDLLKCFNHFIGRVDDACASRVLVPCGVLVRCIFVKQHLQFVQGVGFISEMLDESSVVSGESEEIVKFLQSLRKGKGGDCISLLLYS